MLQENHRQPVRFTYNYFPQLYLWTEIYLIEVENTKLACIIICYSDKPKTFPKYISDNNN